MLKEKQIGQVLLFLALLVIVNCIVDNGYFWFFTNTMVIIVTIVSGVILISGDKELK